MCIRFISLIIVLNFFAAKGQESIVVMGTIKNNTKYRIATLEKFIVGSYPICKMNIDSGRLKLIIPKVSIEPGIYRLRYSQIDVNAYLDIVIAGDSLINFQLDALHPELPPVFYTSETNRQWYTYRFKCAGILSKIYDLESFIATYTDEKSSTYVYALKERKDLINELTLLRNRFVHEGKNSLTARYESNKPFKFYKPQDPYQLKAYYEWDGYWNGINTVDTSLYNTPLFTEHIINFMRYWVDAKINFSEKEKTEGFIKSVDTIMNHFARSPLRVPVINYLTAGFKELGEEATLQYIDEKYNNIEQCTGSREQTELEKRLLAYKLLRPGMPAPQVFYTNLKGVEQEYLKNVKSDTIIVAFWASWCTHCNEAIPLLNKLANDNKSIKILAISLDTSSASYANVVNQYQALDYYCDYRGWESKPVKDYHIAATPTFYMIDKDGYIIGKYVSFTELCKALNYTP